MSARKLDAHRNKRTFNIGDWLSAKIYSDVKGGCVHCDGRYTAYKKEAGIDLPICNKCSTYPPFFRIRAKVIDEHNIVKNIDIRHVDPTKRITEYYECMTILRQVDREIEAGTFDVTKYGSKRSRESYLFKNFAKVYIEHHRLRFVRGEITYYGHKNQKKYTNALLKFFADHDLADIDESEIDRYRNSFTKSFTTRNRSTTELKTILKFALKRKKIPRMPEFDPIPASSVREVILDINDARDYIPHTKEPQYKLIFFLHTIYAWRPCETRAIKLKDCDVANEKIKICRHFSGVQLVDGRKSIKTGDKKELEFDMINELKKWINEQCRWLGPDDYIFQQIPSKQRVKNGGNFMPRPGGKPLGERTLSKAWTRTLIDAKAPHVDMYEMRGARGTEVAELSNGNMLVTRDFLGHTSTKTTEKHYIRNKNVSGNFINKEAEIVPITG